MTMKPASTPPEVNPVLCPWFINDLNYAEIDSCLLKFYKISELIMQVNSSQEELARSILVESFLESFNNLYSVIQINAPVLPNNLINRLLLSLEGFSVDFIAILSKGLLHVAREELSVFLNAVFYLKKPGDEHLFFYKAYKTNSRFASTNVNQFSLARNLTANGFTTTLAACLSDCESFLSELTSPSDLNCTYDFIAQEALNLNFDIDFFPPSWLNCESESVLESYCSDFTIEDSLSFKQCYETLAPEWGGSLRDIFKTCESFCKFP